MINHEVVRYYEQIAAGPYDRWGQETMAFHFGYWDDAPNFATTEPEEVIRLHIQSQFRMASAITNFVNPSRGEWVLDAGCGAGSMFESLTERGARVVGVNITPGHLRKARNHIQFREIEGAYPVLADYSRLPLPDGSMDKVLMVESLTHAQDQEGVIDEADLALKPKGSITVVEPMLTKPRKKLGEGVLGRVQEIDNGMFLRVTSYIELLRIFEKFEYEVMEREITNHVYPSMQLAAASAEAHAEDADVSEEVANHRAATIAYRDLAESGDLVYKMVKATRQS